MKLSFSTYGWHDLEWDDFVSLARGSGVEASCVTTARALREAVQRAVAGGRPALVDARVQDPESLTR